MRDKFDQALDELSLGMFFILGLLFFPILFPFWLLGKILSWLWEKLLD